MVYLQTWNFSTHKTNSKEKTCSWINILFYFSTHRLSKICSLQTTVKKRPYILKVSKNVFFGYFAKAIAGENGPEIRHILLNLVQLGGKFLFQCNLSFARLGMLMFKSDRYDSILQFFFLLLLISLPKNVQVLHGLTCLGGAA